MVMQGMIRVTIRLADTVADLVGHQALEYSLPQHTQLAGLFTMLYVKYPMLADKFSSLRVELNGKTVNMHTELVEDDEVTINLQEDG